jgi:hypothetical protein
MVWYETSNSTVKATSSSGYYYSDFAATTNPARVYRGQAAVSTDQRINKTF